LPPLVAHSQRIVEEHGSVSNAPPVNYQANGYRPSKIRSLQSKHLIISSQRGVSGDKMKLNAINEKIKLN